MRHGPAAPIVVFLALLALALPRVAQGASSSERFPVGGPDMARAMSVAEDFWGRRACRGRVALRWRELASDTRGQASWKNALDAWNRPGRNFDCAIALNRSMRFSWPQLCTTVVHEVGHLLGRRHSRSRRSVMYEWDAAPIRECGGTRRVRG